MLGHQDALEYGYSFSKIASLEAFEFQKNLSRTIIFSLTAVLSMALGGDKKALDSLME